MHLNQHQGLLTYCSNIHPGESWQKTFENIRDYTTQVKDRMRVDSFGIGLRLSNEASLELMQDTKLSEFRDWLDREKLFVFTINGFPYGGFHNLVVKDDVHHPDWSKQDRFEYTIRLFEILRELLPAGLDGGVSTSPISYKFWHNDLSAIDKVKRKAAEQIADVVIYLSKIADASGQILHLDMEPEPDGILETASEFVAFFNDFLLRIGRDRIVRILNCTSGSAEEMIRRHFHICYDVCHFAVGFEDSSEALDLILNAGISVGRIQISAAVTSGLISTQEALENAIAELRAFDEPTYLHQAVVRTTGGLLQRFRDLNPALDSIASIKEKEIELRTHFHVPVFTNRYKHLFSTQPDIMQVLKIWKERNFTNHLEVETYTWDVLPADMQTDIVSSIVRELEWVIDNIPE